MNIGKVLIIIGIILFVIGSVTGTITGYQGANGLFYADPGAVGSREWMCLPALIMVVIGIIINKKQKKD